MPSDERPRPLLETTLDTFELPVGVSASRSIRDFETPSTMHVLLSEPHSSRRHDGAGSVSHPMGVRWLSCLEMEAEA